MSAKKATSTGAKMSKPGEKRSGGLGLAKAPKYTLDAPPKDWNDYENPREERKKIVQNAALQGAVVSGHRGILGSVVFGVAIVAMFGALMFIGYTEEMDRERNKEEAGGHKPGAIRAGHGGNYTIPCRRKANKTQTVNSPKIESVPPSPNPASTRTTINERGENDDSRRRRR